MDHAYIEEHNLADRYVMGALPDEERILFEEHFVDCQECLDRLDTAEGWRDALKTAVAAGPSRSGVLAWLAQTARWKQAAVLAAAGVVLVILPAGLLWMQLDETRGRLEQAKNAAEAWQRRYQAARSASLPETLPVFALTMTRGAQLEPSAPADRIVVPSSVPVVVLLLDRKSDSGFLNYRASLSDGRGRVLWTASDLEAAPPGTLALSLPTSLLPPGDYALILEGFSAPGRPVPAGHYSFQVER